MRDFGQDEANDFGRAALYTGVAEPLIALSQIGSHTASACGADKLAGKLDQTEQKLSAIGLKAPTPADTAPDKHAQMLGSAVGMMLPYLALHGAMRGAATQIFDEKLAQSATNQLEHTAAAESASFNRAATREVNLSFAAGTVYNGFLKPSDNSKNGSGFLCDRAINGLAGGTAMALMTTSNLALSRLGTSNIAEATGAKAILTNRIGARVISAVPAGLVQTEIGSLRNGHGIPQKDALYQNIYNTAFISLALGGLTPNKQVEQGQPKLIDAAKLPEVTEQVTAPKSVADSYRTGAITNLESPLQRATRLNLPADMERSKAILFGTVATDDGAHDVIIRPFNSGSNSAQRVYRANLSERVGNSIAKATGVNTSALPMVIRDNFVLPKMDDPVFNWEQTTTEPVIIQPNGGKQLGTQLREWALQAQSAKLNEPAPYPNTSAPIVQTEPEVGAIRHLVTSEHNVRALMGRAAFDNMFKGNVDLTEFSQQTIAEGLTQTSIAPARDLHLVSVDNKGDFTLLSKPTWGFGSQFGLTLEVAKALEGQRLDSVDPALQADAGKLEQFFGSPAGRAQLQIDGLTAPEIDAALLRLQSLVHDGFPKHLGDTNFYQDDAETQLTASLSAAYDEEAAPVQTYLSGRDSNLQLRSINGISEVAAVQP